MAITLTVKPRSSKPSSKPPVTVTLESTDATVGDLKRSLVGSTRLNVHRQRLTTQDKKVLDDDDRPLSAYGLANHDVVDFKDLGPQVAWKTVFLTEYFGPLFIHPLFYFGNKVIYRTDFAHSRMQKVALALILIHYAKRELETLFVHRFSSATMPILNLFKNSGHYWGLSGILLAVPLYGPWNGAGRLVGTVRDNDVWLYAWVALWTYAEVSNLVTHLNLASLRPAGTKTRQVPRGYGFNVVSCANYWFEAVAWVAFTGLTLDYAAAFFTVVAVGQMYVWAVKKHKRYRKEFGDKYPRGRKAMFPYVA